MTGVQTCALPILEVEQDDGEKQTLTYKLMLVVRDAASRYLAARPLENKKAKTVLAAITDIYGHTPLNWPKKMYVDSGTEFKGEFELKAAEHATRLIPGEAGDKRHTSLAETVNRTLAKRLFEAQYADEDRTGIASHDWVANLPLVVAQINRLPAEATKLAPNSAVEQAAVQQRPRAAPGEKEALQRDVKTVLVPGDMVRVPLKKPHAGIGVHTRPGDRFRATDLRWSSPKKILNVMTAPLGAHDFSRYLVEGSNKWYIAPMLKRVSD